MGIFLDGFDLFIMAVALPVIVADLAPGSAALGAIGAAALVGGAVGAAVIGRLTDRLGRRAMYQLDLWLFVVFSLLSALSPNVAALIGFRFLLGVGIGADYLAPAMPPSSCRRGCAAACWSARSAFRPS